MLKVKSFFGDWQFYRRVLGVAVPIMIQNGITNFVSLLDNIMVGQVGEAEMSGVAIANLLMFVFNLCIFGAVSGVGIFTAQYHGSKDSDGIRYTFRYKLISSVILTALMSAIFIVFGDDLISLFLKGEGSPESAAMSLACGYEYLLIMLIGILPFALSNTYGSTLRETGQTVVPMIGGGTAVIVNLVLNYILIFGHFGAPEMGVLGAAVATVVSRYVELAIIVLWTHLNSKKNLYIKGVYRSLYIPSKLVGRFFVKGSPLLLNEFLWSLGVTVMNQSYSIRGQSVVAAQNIATTLNNLSSVVYMALGVAVGIIMGQMLGQGAPEAEVRSTNKKLITTSVLSCVVFAAIMAAISPLFPMIYEVGDEVKHTATKLILVAAALMPVHAFAHSSYFTIRSGGQTGVTFLFDSGFMWVVNVPLTICLSYFTGISIVPLYAICQGVESIKCLLGAYVLHKGTWINNLAKP